MQKGDISNFSPQRFLFVFEGLVATLEPVAAKKEAFHRRLHRWDSAVRCWGVNDTALSYLWDLAWRHHVAVDVATFLPYPIQVERYLEQEAVPYAHLLHFDSPDALAKRLAWMPQVHRVYYCEPPRRFVFGDRGMYVPDMQIFDPLG